MNTQTALQVTDFNFYGYNLIALKDNATGEIYTAINSVLRGIGFIDRDQIRKRRDKWINDPVISKGISIFNIPTSEGVTKKDTPMNNQAVYCISQHKLPIALAKINITPKMKQTQPKLASKLELYQDKCADVLASVFIDRKTVSDMNMQPITETLNAITNTLTTLTQTMILMQQEINSLKKPQQLSKKKWSYWSTKMFPKYQLLTDYFQISNTELYKNLYRELENTYPEIDLNQEIDDYCYENNLESAYTLDVIEHNLTLRKLFEAIVDNLLNKYNLADTYNINTRTSTIFD
ncbi:MAG: phage antirepressor N-terminal domain-containing protein [Eubacteriales bacterium]|nr:phage antirepressor N-terminal domain-containing protein [Eubacteriales bacterium]